jgi:hypothetical protein
MTDRRPYISDHAMLRYLERVVGIDVDAHRREVERRVALAVALGASAVVRDGMRYVIRDFRVTTVAPSASDPRFPRLQRPDEER